MSFFGSLRTFILAHPENSIGEYTYGDFDLHWWGESVPLDSTLPATQSCKHGPAFLR